MRLKVLLTRKQQSGDITFVDELLVLEAFHGGLFDSIEDDV